jgi:hypothetical protein
MGRTFTVARTGLLHNCPFQLSFSWELAPARVKASGRGAKCYLRTSLARRGRQTRFYSQY